MCMRAIVVGAVLSIVITGVSACLAGEAPFDCWAVSDVVRVFEDGYNAPAPQDAVEVFGIRDETVCGQCVVKAHKPVAGLTVDAGPLTLSGDGAVIPAECVGWNFVGSISIDENTPKSRQADLIRPAPARFPDYLSDETAVALKPGQFRSVYLTIRIPRDAAAGRYEGAVHFRSGQGAQDIPVRLTVYPLVLPDQRHLMVTEWFSTNRFKQFHGIERADSDRFYDMLSLYAQNMADHRQNVFRISLDLITSTRRGDGSLAFDFSRFDKWAEVFWATGRMDLLETGFVARFAEGGWSSREIVLRDFRVTDEASGKTVTLPGETFLPRFLPALEQHLREKGWLDKTIFHIADEPSNHNIMSWREASDFVHRHAPALRRIDAIETPHCLDRLEIWVPKLDHFATWQDAFREAQSQGCELWFYTVGIFQAGPYPNKTVDVPLIQSRTLHWFNYRFGLKGYLHWGFNHWTDHPFESPGKHRGDGWHVYPRRDGLLDSLRWEQMRNGIQDYECLWLLENEIRRMTTVMSPRVSALIQPSLRSREIASQVVRTTADYSNDPQVLYAARRRVIDELLALCTPPQIVVQTNPPEHARVAQDAAIDVYGWTQPDTAILINGRRIPVAADGLFLENVRLTSDGIVVIEAQGRGSKRIVRRFKTLQDTTPGN